MSESLRQIRTRLDACARAIEEALLALPEETPSACEEAPTGRSLTCFRLAGERFALSAPWVQGPARPGRPTPLPMAGTACVGVLDVDGQLLPVFDPGVLLGLRTHSPREGVLLPVGSGAAECVLLADHVEERTQRSRAHAPPWPLPSELRPLVDGLLEDGTVLLDGARLLEDPRLGSPVA